MAVVEKLQTYLDLSDTRYTHTVHPRAYTAQEVAQAERLPAHALAKSVVFRTDAGFALAVLPADEHIDLVELKKLIGVQHIRLATEYELSVLFADSEVGAMAPFGNLYGLPVYVDNSLTREEVIAFNAGTHRDVIHMRYADFERLVGPSLVSFGKT